MSANKLSHSDALSVVVETLITNEMALSALEVHQELTERGETDERAFVRLSSWLSLYEQEQGEQVETISSPFTKPFGSGSISEAFAERDQQIATLMYELRLAKEDNEELKRAPLTPSSVAPSLTASLSPLGTPNSPAIHTTTTEESKILFALIKKHLIKTNCTLAAHTLSDEAPVAMEQFADLQLAEDASLLSLLRNNKIYSEEEEDDDDSDSNGEKLLALTDENEELKRENDALKTRLAEIEEENAALEAAAANTTDENDAVVHTPSTRMAEVLAKTLPELTRLIPLDARLEVIHPLLIQAIAYVPNPKQQKSLILGLLLLLKKPNKAQRDKVSEASERLLL